ncbi:phage major capsid protein [Acuticoccus sediminis]|uniref:phage major capsid protein n=1 Tax=Acuticoccus sediminis TaxID=2184697 RepID=UPI001CFC4ECF|nr:phage major capsid protein [Acuticoccus sediminis]
MNRMYSLLTVKAVEEDERVIRGVATTPSPDRVGDIVEPLGVKFNNPMPLLHQHDSSRPVGTVTFDKPTKDGITFEAKLPKIVEPGPLKDRVDTAWGEVKAGLVRAVSIGFRALEYAFIEGSYGIRFLETEVFELSLVSVPANADATISNIKSIDRPVLAATGKEPKPDDRPEPPGASGKTQTKTVNLRPKEATRMTLAEQITALEAKRAAHASRMTEVMQKSIDEGRSTDTSEQEEFDGLERDVETIDADLKRLRTLERMNATNAKPVNKTAAPATNGHEPSPVRVKKKSAPGIDFARLAKVKAIAHLDHEPAREVAKTLYGEDSAVYGLVTKANVVAGADVSGNWADALVGDETSVYADFAEFLRPMTILGKFGNGNIPNLRRIPFRTPLITQTGGGQAYWVGEGKPKPLTAFDFSRTTLDELKVATISVVTEELLRKSSPSADMILRDQLAAAVAARIDQDFIDPANAGTASVKPASITNGADSIVAQSYSDGDSIRTDVRALMKKFIDANNPLTSGVWIMSSNTALAGSLIVNALGQTEFPGLTMTGGTFQGLPVITSEYVTDYVALANALDIYLADEGGVMVDVSREASLQMLDNPTNDTVTPTATSMVSMWQTNSVAFRAERILNWARRRATSVAYLTSVGWGGAVPAS